MKVCAIVPTYNRKDFLIECLESLLAQTRPLDEIIVIIDGSTDGTAAALAPYAGRITCVEQENAGKSVALNRGLGMTSADLVWICDDDDVAVPDALENLTAPFAADPALDIVFAKHMRFVVVDGEKRLFPAAESIRPGETNMNLSFWENMVSYQFATLARRQVYSALGGFDTELKRSLDYDMALRMTRGRRATYLDKVVFLQREHDGARGPGGKIVSLEQNLRTWMKNDQIIIRRILPLYDITEFTPAFAQTYAAADRKAAAHLERGLVLGKRGFWSEAADSFIESAAPEKTLTPEESQLCRLLPASYLSYLLLTENRDATKKLRQLRKTPRGREILMTLLLPLRWMVRVALQDRKWQQARAMTGLLLTIAGPVETLRIFGSRKGKYAATAG